MLNIDINYAKFGLKAAIAIVFSYWVATYFQIPHSIWLPISTCVVLRMSLGESVKRISDRLLGTVMGVIIAFLLYHTLYLWLPSPMPLLFALIFIVGFILRINYFWCMAIIVPLLFLGEASMLPQAPTNIYFVYRILNITGGVFIGFIVVSLIFPNSSKKTVERNTSQYCQAASEYINKIISQKPNTQDLKKREIELTEMVNNISKHYTDVRYEPTELFRSHQKGKEIEQRLVELTSALKQFRFFFERRTVKPIPFVRQSLLDHLKILSIRLSHIETKKDLRHWDERAQLLETIKLNQSKIRETTLFEKYGIERVIRASAALHALETLITVAP